MPVPPAPSPRAASRAARSSSPASSAPSCRPAPPPSPAPSSAPSRGDSVRPDPHATEALRWAVFSCFLVPVVLIICGTSLAGALGTALGLAVVTAVCRLLLRRSERGLPAPHPTAPRGRRHPAP